MRAVGIDSFGGDVRVLELVVHDFDREGYLDGAVIPVDGGRAAA